MTTDTNVTTAKSFSRGEKLKIAISLINANPTMPEGQIGKMIADTLEIKLGNAIHNYYKAVIRKGLTNITNRVPDAGKTVFTRKAKAKTAPATKEVAVETLLPPAAVMQTTGATLVVPAPTQPKKMTVEEFKAGLARARAKVRVEETKQSEGEMEIPSFLRRA